MEPEKWVVEENSLPMSKGPFSGSMLVFLGVCIYIHICVTDMTDMECLG